MSFLGRSKYNLLKYKKRENPNLKVEDWEIFDYKKLSIDELFSNLSQIGFEISIKDINDLANDSIELDEVDLKQFHKAKILQKEDLERGYLYLFEIWRRLMPNHKSISIFANDFDEFIDAYEKGEVAQNELLFNELFDILDESVDEGQDPKGVFKQLSNYFGHDLESFIICYIFDLIEQDNETTASRYLDNIYPYLAGNLWLEFFRIKLLKGALSEDITAMTFRFLDRLKLHFDAELAFEVLYYMIETGHKELFKTTYKSFLKEIKTEDEFREMLEILHAFFSLNEQNKEEMLVKELIDERRKVSMTKKIGLVEKKVLQELIR
jgi:hypothetical protein